MLACKGKNLYLTSGVNSNILKIQGYCLAEEILTENRRCDKLDTEISESGDRMSEVRKHFVFHGKVQGVGFRYTTQYEAKKLGLTGYAKNLDDGSVEVVACGEEGQVEKLMQWLKSGGPRSARVERVLSEPHHPSGELTDFRIR